MESNYIKEALRTDHEDYSVIVPRFNAEVVRLLHAGMGLTTEAGEFMDAIKRHTMYGSELDKTNLCEELGDLMWYIALACDTLGISIEDIMRLNVSKLQARYPNKFTEHHAQCRDLVFERKVIEQSC